MLVKKYWFGRKRPPLGHRKAYYGWFLFGVIPLCIIQVKE